MANLLKKQFINFVGLDLKSSNLNRQDQFSTDMKNAQYQKDGDIEKRRGYKGHAASQGGFGLFNYNLINTTTGIIEPQLLCADTQLNRLVEDSLLISYGGADPTAVLSIFFDVDNDEYRCQILEGTSLVVDESLGKGIDEATPVDLSDLDTVINATVNFTSTLTGDGTTPAAFLNLVRSHDLVSGDATVVAHHWEQVNSPIASPFAGSDTNKATEDFENISSVQLNNVIYLSNGYDEVYKYDSQTLYRAGMPAGGSISTALGGAGALTGTYRHAYRYVQKDAVGNFIEGDISEDSADLTPAAQSIDVTVDNIQASSGFNTNCAIVAGAQVTVNTITVDDGSGGSHTMQVGDTAYFFDSVTGDYVEREVTAIAATTITVAGAAVTVADNAVISNNLRIQIYRNQNGGLFKYLVEEIPNDSFSATQVLNDNVTDANLGIQFIPPIVDRGLPPKGKYLSAFNSQMVIGGNLEAFDIVYYSDIESPEYFPISNNIRTETDGNEKISGLGQSNEVFAVFKTNSIDIISGEIETGNIRRETITNDLGCASHHTIKEVDNRLFFLSDRGVYSLTSGQLPKEESTLIEPAFDQTLTPLNSRFNLKRAIAINRRKDQQYILFLPNENTVGGNIETDLADSFLFVLDYYRDAWLKWNNIDFAGGAVVHNGDLYWTEKRIPATFVNYLYQQMSMGDQWDYMDHDSPVEFEYKSNWIHLGEPSVFKHWVRIKVHAFDQTQNNPLFDLSLRGESDFIDGLQIFDIDLDFSGAALGYGLSPYGTAPYGDVSRPSVKHKLNIKNQALRLTFVNSTEQQNVQISGYELDVATAYRAEIKE